MTLPMLHEVLLSCSATGNKTAERCLELWDKHRMEKEDEEFRGMLLKFEGSGAKEKEGEK